VEGAHYACFAPLDEKLKEVDDEMHMTASPLRKRVENSTEISQTLLRCIACHRSTCKLKKHNCQE
jgi:hypothetical protein